LPLKRRYLDEIEHNLARINAVLAKPKVRAIDRVILIRAKGRLEGIKRYRERLPKRPSVGSAK
jgi:hypothetical protein